MRSTSLRQILPQLRSLAVVFVLTGLLGVGPVQGQLRMAVLSDLPRSERVDGLIDEILAETRRTLGVNQRITAPEELRFFDLSSGSEAGAVYARTQADLWIAIGGVAVRGIADEPRLRTPVIGLGIMDPGLQGIPYEKGRSGKKGLTYVLTSRDLINEIQSFRSIMEFGELTLVTDPAVVKGIAPTAAQALLDSLQNSLGIRLRTVQASADPRATLEAIGQAEAVYLASLYGKDPAYIQELSSGFLERGIPAFSSLKAHVDLGLLASTSGDNSTQQVVRRVALLANDLLAGHEAADQPVNLHLSEDIYLNVRTAKALGVSPPFDLLLTAHLVGERTDGRSYSFNEIAEAALETNLDIQVSYKDIELSELDIRSNRALVLPDLTSGLTAVQINEERANALINSSEQTLTLDLVLTQVIYSEEALAAIRISKYLRNAQEHRTRAEVLDVLLDTYGAYLNVLSAKTNLSIQRRNLENTKTNLELARIRVAVGSSNNADTYRWESEVARATQSVIDAQSGYLTTQLQLNNLLANSLGRDYAVADIGLEDSLFLSFRQSPIARLVRSPADLQRAADFLVKESLERNPNKQLLLENIKASEHQLTMTKRLFYTPTIALQAQGSQILGRGGAGSEAAETTIPGVGIGLQDRSWSIAANLTFPLFIGLNRQVNRQRSMVQLEQLDLSNTSLDQALDLSIRASTIQLLSSTTNLEYSRVAAESASKNFELVQNNYKEGTVNITQVIDAQEAALNAELGAALAVYEYILANLQLEYSVGAFSMFLTEDEIRAFYNRFLEFSSQD